MKRFVASLALGMLFAGPLFAQKPGEPVLLTIRPADLPQPSLKYRLFPDRGQLTDGNAPTQYYRALSLFVENQALLDDLSGEHWEKWLATPLKDLPRTEAPEKVGRARSLIRELEIAGKRKRCDWQLDGRPEGLRLHLPDVVGFLRVARPLAVRARLSIAEGSYAAACATLQIGYALAHHMGQGPTHFHVLLGMAIANMMTDQLETLLRQPDAPNLYWSLTVMPRPFADFMPSLYEGPLWVEQMFPWLKQLDGTALSEAQVKAAEEALDHFSEEMAKDFNVNVPTEFRTARAIAMAQATAEGKSELVTRYQFSKEQVAAMPSFQVAALYAFRDYKEAVEEVVKWAHVPEGWKHPAYKTTQERYEKALRRLDHLYFGKLLEGLRRSDRFSLEYVALSAARVDRRLAALRCVEAIRQYAAKHDGKMPAALADVKELPIPNDPLSGKPFEYAVNGDKATLKLAKPAEQKPNPNELLTYYLTMPRAKD